MQTRRTWLAGAGVTVILGGCGLVKARPSDPPAPRRPGEIAEIVGYPRIRTYGDLPFLPPLAGPNAGDPLDRAVLARLAADREIDVLALSGGGDDGAYGAGFLTGWSARGDRPSFDLVTGVSTGALIAPMAFLGAAQDGALRQFYTRTGADRIYRLRVLELVTGGLSAADSAPLARRIAEVVTPDFVAALAAERRKGRLLLIGTTDLDAQRQVTWDIGRIAASGQPGRVTLIRQVLLASAAIPGAFPPVTFEVRRDSKAAQELHVDGAVTAGLFAYPPGLTLPPRAGTRRMWLIRNAKIAPEWQATRADVLGIAGRSVSTLLKAQARGDMKAAADLAARDGFRLRMTAVPPNFGLISTKPFDPGYMRALFEVGRAAGLSGTGWGSLTELSQTGG